MEFPRSDYSEWIVGDRLKAEDAAWLSQPERTQYYAELVSHWTSGESILEIGCGTGLLAAKLRELGEWDYVGVDANPECLALAQQRNPRTVFTLADVRNFNTYEKFDVVCAFAFFKHFRLSEWEGIVARVLNWAKRAVFTVAVSDTDHDDGVEFPHVWVTRETLESALFAAGHVMIWNDEQIESTWVSERE